jgi:hypothetical protein
METPEKSVTHPIAKTLQADPVSVNIVQFLLKNRQAMDSAKGIAAWWVSSDEVAVQAALDRLIACGAVTAHTFKSCTLYGLTPNEETRGWLETWFDGHPPASKANGGPKKKRSTQSNLGSVAVVTSPEPSNE